LLTKPKKLQPGDKIATLGPSIEVVGDSDTRFDMIKV